jgi:ribose 5-phosphate isomerase A
MDKKQAAALAAIDLLQGKQRIGLGAGSTIAALVEAVARTRYAQELEWYTASFGTQQLLLRHSIPVQSIAGTGQLDMYFDGCDQLDYRLNALKSGGGIHTREKLLASMASAFILLGDLQKRVETFDPRYPLVVELVPDAQAYLELQLASLPNFQRLALRHSTTTEGPAITSQGNYLLDTWFSRWPDLEQLNATVKSIAGVLEHSLFYQLAGCAVLGTEEGTQVFY